MAFLIVLGLFVASCGGKDVSKKNPKAEKALTYEDSLNAKKDSLKIESNYDMATVDKKNQQEFVENLAKIENKYGVQWDFCTDRKSVV